jgi:hypothetical protein
VWLSSCAIGRVIVAACCTVQVGVALAHHLTVSTTCRFCDNGTLFDFVSDRTSTDIDVQTLLTHCYETCLGMHYLSSRRICPFSELPRTRGSLLEC